MLVKAGANVNAKDNDGRTPLNYLSKKDKSYYEIKKIFAGAGAK